VHDPQQHRGRIGHLLRRPPTAQLQLRAGSLAPLYGWETALASGWPAPA
jgi:hypothetical protein